MMGMIIDDYFWGVNYCCVDYDSAECIEVYQTFEEASSFIEGWNYVCKSEPKSKNSLAQLEVNTPVPQVGWNALGYKTLDYITCVIQEEGKTPMRYNDNCATATAAITNAKSDAAIQRDYFISQLGSAKWPKLKELTKFFNLNVDNTPKTYAQMIDIIKAGTYTIDPKIAKRVDAGMSGDDDEDDYYHAGPLYGIIWPGPVADPDGYKQAEKDMQVQFTKAERAIVAGDAAAGLAAVEAFEAWLPTPATPAN